MVAFQVLIAIYGRSYLDDTSNYFLSTEYFERFTPAISLLGSFSGVALSSRLRCDQLIATTLTLAVCGALASRHYLGFASVTNTWTDSFFGGFGIRVMLTSFVLAIFVLYSRSLPVSVSTKLNFSQAYNLTATMFISVLYLPSTIVTSQSIFHTDFAYVLNEILGPASNHAPLQSSVPQYSALIGWPLVAISGLPLSLFLELAVIYVTLLFYCIVFCIVVVIRGIFPQISIPVATLIPITILLARPTGQTSGSFIMFPSAIVRNFFPILLIALLFIAMRSVSTSRIVALGITAGLSSLNNVEFGLVATVAIAVAALLGAIFRSLPRRFPLTLLASYVATLATLIALLRLDGFSWWSYKFFATAYGSGNNNIPMPIFGLHTITMVVASLAVVVGLIDMIATKGSGAIQVDNDRNSLSILLLAAGLAGLGFHLYYTGRSMVSTQLQTEFPILIICVTALFRRFRVWSLVWSDSRKSLAAVPFMMISVLPVSALWLAPDPTIEVSRLRGRLPESEFGSVKLGFTQINLSDFSGFLRQVKLEYPKSSIGFIADHNGNALKMIHKIDNLLPFNDMNDITDIAGSSQTAVCTSIQESGVDLVAVEKDDGSTEAFAYIINCKSIQPIPVFQSPFGALFRTSTVG